MKYLDERKKELEQRVKELEKTQLLQSIALAILGVATILRVFL